LYFELVKVLLKKESTHFKIDFDFMRLSSVTD